MQKHRSVLAVAFSVLFNGAAVAQTVVSRPGPTATPTEREKTAALLRSTDARKEASGAWFAGRDHRRVLVPLLQRVVASRAPIKADIMRLDLLTPILRERELLQLDESPFMRDAVEITLEDARSDRTIPLLR